MSSEVWDEEPIPEFKEFQNNFSSLSEKFVDLVDGSLEEKEMDRKTQELILIALLAGKFENGFKFHINEAKKHGATKDEVAGTILLTLPYCGISTFLKALSWANEEKVF